MLYELDCDINAMCINDDGSYSCQCNHGFLGDGITCNGTLSSDNNYDALNYFSLFFFRY